MKCSKLYHKKSGCQKNLTNKPGGCQSIAGICPPQFWKLLRSRGALNTRIYLLAKSGGGKIAGISVRPASLRGKKKGGNGFRIGNWRDRSNEGKSKDRRKSVIRYGQ